MVTTEDSEVGYWDEGVDCTMMTLFMKYFGDKVVGKF